jgi:TPR repeat protein
VKKINIESFSNEDAYAAFERDDYATALPIWRAVAEQGDVAAQNCLGFVYSEGQGVTQDYRKALKWYRLAAEQVVSSCCGTRRCERPKRPH